MKVILQETMDGVGHLGDLLDVKAGYARNFLLPRKKAVLADSRSIKAFEHIKRVAGERAKKEKLEIETQEHLGRIPHGPGPGRQGRQDVRVGHDERHCRKIGGAGIYGGSAQDPAGPPDQGTRHLHRADQASTGCDCNHTDPRRQETGNRNGSS